jgi:beta-galactosidase
MAKGVPAYVGCRLGREGLAATLPDLLARMCVKGFDEASDASVLRVERVRTGGQERFVFLFNRTHRDVAVDIEARFW